LKRNYDLKFKTLLQALLVTGLIFGQTQASQGGSIKDVISKQEAQKGIPEGLLRAIAKIESGISPWSINSRGRSHIFQSKEAAARYIKQLVGEGHSNFSVGCMQLHYASHRRNFSSVEAMLEPENNIAHAAKLIKNLERRTGSMERAVKFYHSASPSHHNPYQKRVYGVWAKIRGSAKPKDPMVNTVSYQEGSAPKVATTPLKRAPKIKMGIGGAASKAHARQKA
jgi:hypothetical protein